MSRKQTIVDWVESRSALISGAKHFLKEEIPASTGWRNTLGSLLGALLLVQILTGFLLALYYVPHPEAAHASLEFVNEAVLGGSLVRSLHYQGASFIIVALFLHTLRVFYSGAYRAPREGVWLTGLALLGITVAIAFTGQLLPFNQMGYWAASVGIEIASSVPVVGPHIKQLIQGGDAVGAVTLTQFYALHMILLPGLLGLFTALHLFLLRKHSPVRPAQDSTTETDTFYPVQFFRDMVTVSVGLALLIAVALIYGGPHSPPLDLSDDAYIPIPEWYFNSHFEILRMTPPALYVVATFVLPSAVGAVLVLLPWLDRGKSTRLSDRKPIIMMGTVAIVALVGLTVLGIYRNASHATSEHAAVESERDEDPVIVLGRQVYEEEFCATCHKIDGIGETKGPELTHIGSRLQESYLRAWITDPESFRPDTVMPATMADGEKLDALVAFLMAQK